jgi:hypothetical protein
MLIALTWAQAYAGVSWPIWEEPSRDIPDIPTPWISGIRQSLSRLKAKLIISEEYVPKTLRQHDWHIMDVALSSNKFTRTELNDINAYRRFYQATTAADIVDDMGTKIRIEVWNGLGSPQPKDYNTEFFNQIQPNECARRTWKRFLRQVASPTRALYNALGPWTVTHQTCRKIPQWIYHETSQNLYVRGSTNQYTQCTKIGTKYGKPQIHHHTIDNPPNPSYPVATIDFGPVVSVIKNYASIPPVHPHNQNFQEFIESLADWERPLLANITMQGSPQHTASLINEGSILFVASDGSVKNQKLGSYGFIITHVQSKRRIVTGSGKAPGVQPSSLRAEAFGALAVTRFLFRLQEFTGTRLNQRISHWIDNQSLIQRLKKAMTSNWTNPYSTLQPEWDVITETASTLKQLPGIIYNAKWIKSHQDTAGNRPTELSLMEP